MIERCRIVEVQPTAACISSERISSTTQGSPSRVATLLSGLRWQFLRGGNFLTGYSQAVEAAPLDAGLTGQRVICWPMSSTRHRDRKWLRVENPGPAVHKTAVQSLAFWVFRLYTWTPTLLRLHPGMDQGHSPQRFSNAVKCCGDQSDPPRAT